MIDGFSKATGGKYGRDFTWENYLTSFATSAVTSKISSAGSAGNSAGAWERAGRSLGTTAANGFVSDTIRRNTYGSYDADKETGMNFLERTLQSEANKYASNIAQYGIETFGGESGKADWAEYERQQELAAQKPDWIDSTLDFLGVVDSQASSEQSKNALAAEQKANESLRAGAGLLDLSTAQASAYGLEPGAMVDVGAGNILGGIDGVTFDDDMRARLNYSDELEKEVIDPYKIADQKMNEALGLPKDGVRYTGSEGVNEVLGVINTREQMPLETFVGGKAELSDLSDKNNDKFKEVFSTRLGKYVDLPSDYEKLSTSEKSDILSLALQKERSFSRIQKLLTQDKNGKDLQSLLNKSGVNFSEADSLDSLKAAVKQIEIDRNIGRGESYVTSEKTRSIEIAGNLTGISEILGFGDFFGAGGEYSLGLDNSGKSVYAVGGFGTAGIVPLDSYGPKEVDGGSTWEASIGFSAISSKTAYAEELTTGLSLEGQVSLALETGNNRLYGLKGASVDLIKGTTINLDSMQPEHEYSGVGLNFVIFNNAETPNISYSSGAVLEFAKDLEDFGFGNTRSIEENLNDFRAAKFIFEFGSAIDNITANLFSHPLGGFHKVNNRNDSVFDGMERENRLYNNFNSQNKPLERVDFIRMRYDYERMIYNNLRK